MEENNMSEAQKTIIKIKQLQLEMHAFSLAFLTVEEMGLFSEDKEGKEKAQILHDVSYMLKDILDGKSVNEAMKRLDIWVETDVD
jgi:hypothetical protein